MPIPVETAAGPGISGKMFSAPGLLARVERSGGRVRWRPKRSCCRPWTPTISTAALLDTQRQRRVLGRERAGRVWATWQVRPPDERRLTATNEPVCLQLKIRGQNWRRDDMGRSAVSNDSTRTEG